MSCEVLGKGALLRAGREQSRKQSVSDMDSWKDHFAATPVVPIVSSDHCSSLSPTWIRSRRKSSVVSCPATNMNSCGTAERRKAFSCAKARIQGRLIPASHVASDVATLFIGLRAKVDEARAGSDAAGAGGQAALGFQ